MTTRSARSGLTIRSTFLIWLAPGLGLELTALIIFSACQPAMWTTLAIGLVMGTASLLAGGLIGFVFGVPRVLANEGRRAGGSMPTIVANTNLEQISDWLTKILVGVGLTQFRAIAAGAGNLFATLAPALGGGRVAEVFAGGLMTYTAAFGFITGWLSTRLLLAGAMADADRRAIDLAEGLLSAATNAERSGDADTAQLLRERASDLLENASNLGLTYEDVRRRMLPSDERTRELERIVAQARTMATTLTSIDKAEISSMFRRGTKGDRITALGLMQGRPELIDVSAVVDAIGDPMSSFEQYHALLLAEMAISQLGKDKREAIASVVRDRLSTIEPFSDRRSLAERILAREFEPGRR